MRPELVTPRALFIIHPDGSLQEASSVKLTAGDTRATFSLDPPLATTDAFSFNLSNAAADVSGELLPPSSILRWTATVGALTTITSTSPTGGEEAVAVTRETVIRFANPIDPGGVDADSFFAQFVGKRSPRGCTLPRTTRR